MHCAPMVETIGYDFDKALRPEVSGLRFCLACCGKSLQSKIGIWNLNFPIFMYPKRTLRFYFANLQSSFGIWNFKILEFKFR